MWVQTDCQVRSTDRLISDLIYLEDRWKIHWRRQIPDVIYGIPTHDQKILRTAESGIPSKVCEFLFIETVSVGTHTHTHVAFWDHNFTIMQIHSFFRCHVLRPESIGRAGWPGTLWIQTLPYWGVPTKARTSFLESGQFYACPWARAFLWPPRPS